ncbi:hypothetical protein [Catelliglobosispora koreensis]|uniref:hypothetical protein n=1 Tax=Catelliglobosispora koreensis TaxID=129052 RepID=UPI000475E2D4|nr:hypothetical protein [Catelliglobosispora koreensis]
MAAKTIINLVTIRQRLSPERMGRYEADTSGLSQEFDLYEWNMDASAAFHGLLHGVEVLLRNAIHEQMSLWNASAASSGTWFDDPIGVLGPRLIETSQMRLHAFRLSGGRLRRALSSRN